jgi:hypothetical protein
MSLTTLTLKAAVINVQHANTVADFETFALSGLVDLMHDADAFVAHGHRASEVVGAEFVHEIAVAERCCGDFDQNLAISGFWDRDVVDDDFAVGFVVLSCSHLRSHDWRWCQGC